MYKLIWKPKVGIILSYIHERSNKHDRYTIAATKLLLRRLSNVAIGHLPREISRFGKRRTFPTVTTYTRRFRDRLDTFLKKKVEAIERFKRRVEQNYKEPVNGQFDDFTTEVLLEVDMKAAGKFKTSFCDVLLVINSSVL